MQNSRMVVDLHSTSPQSAYRPNLFLLGERDLGKHLGMRSGLGQCWMSQQSDAFVSNSHYLALPVQLKIGRLQEGQKVAFTSFIGLDFHYLLGACVGDMEMDESLPLDEKIDQIMEPLLAYGQPNACIIGIIRDGLVHRP